MSPLPFQKWLCLRDPRHRLLVERPGAAYSVHRESYNDASQFNRKYKRLLGTPPGGERLHGVPAGKRAVWEPRTSR